MNKDSFDKEALIQYRLERSREALDDARLMFEENGSPAGIVNRAYYAMFYSTLAILMTIGKGSSKHQGVIALFDQHFIKTSIFPKELAKTLHRIFELRQVEDYRDLLVISKEQAKEVLESATEFTKTLEEKIKNKK